MVIDCPLKDLNLAETANIQDKDAIYDLYGTINHFGSLVGGHYTSKCYNTYHKNWHRFNDSSVKKVSKSEIIDKSTYILFYKK